MVKQVLSDFKAISFKFSEEYSPHTLYIKEYSPQSYDEEKPLGRTLLALKVSLYLDENDVKKLFSEVGQVVSVNLQKGKPCDGSENKEYIVGYQSAYIIYKNRESLVRTLNLDQFKTLTDEKYKPIRGLCKFIKEYNDSLKYDHSLLLEEAAKAMQVYDKQEEDKRIGEKNAVDDDGWTVVTSKSKNPNSDPKLNEKLDNKKKKKQHKNFYTFQIKESKIKKLAALREGYEEAKRKVDNMKKNRSFKPY